MLTATMWDKVPTDEKQVADEREKGYKSSGEIESIKGDVDWKQWVEKSSKLLWGVGSNAVLNTEWFFTEQEMVTFWKYYQENWFNLGWYKILIRHCKADDFPSSPCYRQDKFAVDVVALRHQRRYLAELMPRFSQTMHASKFLCDVPAKDDTQVSPLAGSNASAAPLLGQSTT
jgi:hypothetical protein